MTTSTRKHQNYSEYINPPIDQYSSQQENPLVLMAQACNNIGKELSLPIKPLPPSPLLLSKQRKSHSPPPTHGKKPLKRIVPAVKKISTCQSSSSSSRFDFLLFHHLNQVFSSSTLPTFQQSPYLIDSILSLPFVCNWIDSSIQDGFCGKRFLNHVHLLEHLCTEHTTIKSLYPFILTNKL